MTTTSHGKTRSTGKQLAIVLLAGAVAVAGLALAAKPSGGGGGGGGGKTKSPTIAVSPSSLDFGEVLIDSTASQSVSVRNSGRADLTITGISLSFQSAFSHTSNCPGTLIPGATCSIDVAFSPAAANTYSATLTITSNDPATPTASVSLSGTGKTAPVTVIRRLEGGGDSIMRGYNASCTGNTTLLDFFCYSGGDQEQNSFLDGWGSSVASLVDRYVQLDPQVTGGKSASKSGSEMLDPAKNNFETQAKAIVAATSRPTRVFVELGGNDICNRTSTGTMYTDDQWRAAVQKGLNVLVNGLPDGSTVVMVSVPRVQDLRAAGIAKETSTSGVNCQNFWASFDVCRIATANGTDLPARLAAISDRQAAYNRILGEEAASYNSQAWTTGVEVIAEYTSMTSESVGSYSFQPTDINGGDCFHPSLQGQNKLAEIIFRRVQGP